MKIAILGTRGIPNYHGGFEQFAEYFSVYMAKQGHEVFVYNSHKHPYKDKEYQGVKIIHRYDPEHRIGTSGQFIYDFNCILDCRRRSFDIVLQLGYTSSSVWGWLLPSNAQIFTNMDGLEWKRSKYSKSVRRFLKYAENWAVKTSDGLIADSIGIKKYLEDTYRVQSTYIPYGADVFKNPEESFLEEYGLSKHNYNMLIARLEPENNIETILDGINNVSNKMDFLVVGKHETVYGRYLKDRYKACSHIRFLGGIYDIKRLNNLRFYSNLYFHGHSVGGTNPSLLEAMASGALIAAHDNVFNKSILQGDAFYFKTSEDIKKLLDASKGEYLDWVDENFIKIRDKYNWQVVNKSYEELLLKSLDKS